MDEEGSSVAGSLSHRNAHAPTAARGDPQSGAVQGKKKSADTAVRQKKKSAVDLPLSASQLDPLLSEKKIRSPLM